MAEGFTKGLLFHPPSLSKSRLSAAQTNISTNNVHYDVQRAVQQNLSTKIPQVISRIQQAKVYLQTMR